MIEQCSCGGRFETSDYKQLKRWRKVHASYHKADEPEKQGSESKIEIGFQRTDWDGKEQEEWEW